MTAKHLTSQHFSMLLTTGILSAGLLLTGCSNSNNDDNTDETAAIASAQDVAAPDTESILENRGLQITDSLEDKSETAITSDNINPLTAATQQPSLVTNPTQAGTPEDTVKQALDILYYGDIKEAATYYKVDMANFTEELKNTQFAFQQTVEAVTIINTKYNADKTRATINGELMLKDQKEPAPLSYELQKVDGQWKILG